MPQPHDNWKVRLLAGRLDIQHVEQFAKLLAMIHHRSGQQQEELAAIFDNRTFFETLRIQPYYRYTASRHPAAANFFAGLIAETAATHVALVHGDYSPKNILICPDRFVLLDHEVLHWGDPAFDIGFSLTHFLSKAHHLPAQRKPFLDAARFYWTAYQSEMAHGSLAAGFESRAVRHTLACLLARVDGRSPLEYLRPDEQQRQRRIALALIESPPETISALIELFEKSLVDESIR